MHPIDLIFSIVLLGLLVFATASAIGWGGSPERVAALLMLSAVVLTNLTAWLVGLTYVRTRVPELAIDAVLAIALIVLALRAQRYWPMWAASAQVDMVAVHILMFSHQTAPISYAYALQAFSLPLPLLIIVGAWRHRARLRFYGDDRAWS